jgi:hypothetical protein
MSYKYLSADQNCGWVLASQAILDKFWQDSVGFLNQLITMDEA